MGFGSMDMMASMASMGTPGDGRRGPSKVALPLLLDEPKDVPDDNEPLSAEADLSLASKAAASSLVLRSVAVLLRGARAAPRHSAAGAAPAAASSLHPGNLDGRLRVQSNALEVLFTGARVSAQCTSAPEDPALMQMLTRRGDLRSQRICALIALMHSLADASTAQPAAAPAASSAADALAVHLLCTSQEAGQSSAADTDLLRRVLLRGISLLSERSMELMPAAMPPAHIQNTHQSPLTALPPPSCEHWTLSTASKDASSQLLRLPVVLARHASTLAERVHEVAPRAELASMLQLAVLMIQQDCSPVAAQAAALAAILPALEVTAVHIAMAAEHSLWEHSLVALMDALLSALAACANALVLPVAAGVHSFCVIIQSTICHWNSIKRVSTPLLAVSKRCRSCSIQLLVLDER